MDDPSQIPSRDEVEAALAETSRQLLDLADDLAQQVREVIASGAASSSPEIAHGTARLLADVLVDLGAARETHVLMDEVGDDPIARAGTARFLLASLHRLNGTPNN